MVGSRKVKLDSFEDVHSSIAPLIIGPLVTMVCRYIVEEGINVAMVFAFALVSGFSLAAFEFVVGGALYLFLRLFDWKPTVSLPTWLIIAALSGGILAAPIVLKKDCIGCSKPPIKKPVPANQNRL
jgi:hypothetical protein